MSSKYLTVFLCYLIPFEQMFHLIGQEFDMQISAGVSGVEWTMAVISGNGWDYWINCFQFSVKYMCCSEIYVLQ